MIRNELGVALRPGFKPNPHSHKDVFSLVLGLVCGAIIFLYLYGELNHARSFRIKQPLVQYHSQRFIEPPSYYANMNGRLAQEGKRLSASLRLGAHEVF